MESLDARAVKEIGIHHTPYTQQEARGRGRKASARDTAGESQATAVFADLPE
jgi:hypothetical protein